MRANNLLTAVVAAGLLAVLFIPAYGENVDILLTPVPPPLPPFPPQYNVTITNHESFPITCETWTKVKFPDGSWMGPIAGPYDLTVQAGATLSRVRVQTVPSRAPAGIYFYCGYVGNYPDVIWDSSGFNFTKMNWDGHDPSEEWLATGEPFGDGIADPAKSVTDDRANVDIYLEPYTSPWWPGEVFYYATVTNNEAFAVVTDVWNMIKQPNGLWMGPTVGPVTFTLPPGTTATRNLYQPIPGTWSPGVYWLYGYVGDYPAVKWDSSGFSFVKLAPDGKPGTGEQLCSSEAPGMDITEEPFEPKLATDDRENVTIKMQRTPPPWWFPEIIDYNIRICNNESAPTTFESWTMIKEPDGNWMGPQLGPTTSTLPPGAVVYKMRSMPIPASWPPGTYWLYGYVGDYPAVKWDSSGFSFVKSTPDDNPGAGEWLISSEPGKIVPSECRLLGNYPNPFNPTSDIRYQIADNRQVSLQVYDSAGRLVSTLVNGTQEAGVHEARFDGTNLAAGVYFARMQAGEYSAVQRMILLK